VAKIIRRLIVGLALIGVGWVAAKAQAPASAPDFELRVDTSGGPTTITCVRGCKLAWVERGINPNANPQQSFDFACTGNRCSSGRIGGWIDP
jgi:hypothetical protein